MLSGLFGSSRSELRMRSTPWPRSTGMAWFCACPYRYHMSSQLPSRKGPKRPAMVLEICATRARVACAQKRGAKAPDLLKMAFARALADDERLRAEVVCRGRSRAPARFEVPIAWSAGVLYFNLPRQGPVARHPMDGVARSPSGAAEVAIQPGEYRIRLQYVDSRLDDSHCMCSLCAGIHSRIAFGPLSYCHRIVQRLHFGGASRRRWKFYRPSRPRSLTQRRSRNRQPRTQDPGIPGHSAWRSALRR